VSKRQRRHDQGDRDAERRKAGSVARRATRELAARGGLRRSSDVCVAGRPRNPASLRSP